MIADKNTIKLFLGDVARRVMAEQPESSRFAIEDETVFIGGRGGFDSITLLSFLIEVEQSIEERYGVQISLADEAALDEPVIPFKTLTLLTDYVHKVLSDRGIQTS